MVSVISYWGKKQIIKIKIIISTMLSIPGYTNRYSKETLCYYHALWVKNVILYVFKCSYIIFSNIICLLKAKFWCHRNDDLLEQSNDHQIC